MDIFGLLKKGTVVADGAMGTLLQEKGILTGTCCPEELNLTHPEVIQDIHRQYIEAGSRLIITHSFGANPFKLRKYGKEEQTFIFNRAAADNARKAVGEGEVLVAGDIGPTGELLEPLGSNTIEDFRRAFRTQIEGLVAGGVDLLIIETMSSIEEVEAVIAAARETVNLPVIASLTFQPGARGYRTMMGVDIATAMDKLEVSGAEIVGANCGVSVAEMIEIVAEIRSFTSRPILAEPNAGLPRLKEGQTVYDQSPESMAEKAVQLVEAGADIVGGCCGTTPEHITAIARRLRDLVP